MIQTVRIRTIYSKQKHFWSSKYNLFYYFYIFLIIFSCRKQGPQSRETVHFAGGGAGCSQPHSGCYWLHSNQAIQQSVSIVNVNVLQIIYSINLLTSNIIFKKNI